MKEVSLDIQITADDAIVWRDDRLYLLDQRKLPSEIMFIECHDAASTAESITAMVVRGAPAIGITAAYGIALAARVRYQEDPANWKTAIAGDLDILAKSRPTAVNLFWAIERYRGLIDAYQGDSPFTEFLNEAQAIHEKDRSDNRIMGNYGASLIDSATSVITHCNAGGLATGGWGTALGVIRSANAEGKIQHVYADETRPWLQGARLTAWEMVQEQIPVSLLVEGAGAARMAAGGIGWIIVGSDRIAGNGDVANKIGTYNLAVAAKYHGVKVMVAAPTSTIDMSLSDGSQIPIEQRSPDEILSCGDRKVAAEGAGAWNPVFDVTPAALVDAIVTEKGIIENPTAQKMAAHMA